MTLLGPSGCGKTTTLSMIGGFVPMTSGSVFVDGEDISALPAWRRNLGVVFQDYALFPHMSVEDNVLFPLKMRSIGRAQARLMVEKMLRLVQLTGYGKRLPNELSGGERQRVALARALVFGPSVLLMDEPLGALDRKLRDEMQGELRRLHEEMAVTILTVTHDQEEALMLSDRIAIMNRGRIEQLGTPREVYDFPQSIFVADFMGESNFISGVVSDQRSESIWFRADSGLACLVGKHVGQISHGTRCTLMVRPERVRFLGPHDSDEVNRFDGMIEDLMFMGDSRKFRIRIDEATHIVASTTAAAQGTPSGRGEAVSIGWSPEDCCLFPEEGLAHIEGDTVDEGGARLRNGRMGVRSNTGLKAVGPPERREV